MKLKETDTNKRQEKSGDLEEDLKVFRQGVRKVKEKYLKQNRSIKKSLMKEDILLLVK